MRRYEPSVEDLSQLVQTDDIVEVRGLVRTENELHFNDLNKFVGPFDKYVYEKMVEFYHSDMFKMLCIKESDQKFI